MDGKWLLILSFVVVIAALKPNFVRADFGLSDLGEALGEVIPDDVNLGDVGLNDMLGLASCGDGLTGDNIEISPECCVAMMGIGWDIVQTLIPAANVVDGVFDRKIKEVCPGLLQKQQSGDISDVPEILDTEPEIND